MLSGIQSWVNWAVSGSAGESEPPVKPSDPKKEDLLELISKLSEKALMEKSAIFEGSFRIQGKGTVVSAAEKSLYSASPSDYDDAIFKLDLDKEDSTNLLKRVVNKFYHEKNGTDIEVEQTLLPTLLRQIVNNEATTKLNEATIKLSMPVITNVRF